MVRAAMKDLVKDYMTKKVITIDSASRISEAAKLLRQHHIGSLIVTENGRPVGMVTDRDIVVKGVAEGLSLDLENVGKITSRPLITTGQNTPMVEIGGMMEKHSIRRVPIVEKGKIVGIITRSDLARAAIIVPRLGLGVPEIYFIKEGRKGAGK